MYIDLEKSCLMEKGKKEVMEMYKYKEAFSLRYIDLEKSCLIKERKERGYGNAI